MLFRSFEGQLLIDGIDIRHLEPDSYHSHVTALFQNFSKFNTTVRENVGVGNVKDAFSESAICRAANHAGAKKLINSLPLGLETQLDCINNDYLPPYEQDSPVNSDPYFSRQGLSGGEVCIFILSRSEQNTHFKLVAKDSSFTNFYARSNIRYASFR